jgi:hypothetical protein
MQTKSDIIDGIMVYCIEQAAAGMLRPVNRHVSVAYRHAKRNGYSYVINITVAKLDGVELQFNAFTNAALECFHVQVHLSPPNNDPLACVVRCADIAETFGYDLREWMERQIREHPVESTLPDSIRNALI